MKITPKQFSDYFESMGASEECPFCKNTDWSIPALGDPAHTFGPDEIMDVYESWIPLVPSAEGTISVRGPYIPIVALTCAKCGFIRHQHVNLLKIFLGIPVTDK
jgi:hypothetical protein